MSSLQIFIDHNKLIEFENLAIEIAAGIGVQCQFEVNINREKTKAYVNIMLINYNPEEISSMYFVDPVKFNEFKNLALDFAKASNAGIKITVRFNEEGTGAQADIQLISITKA